MKATLITGPYGSGKTTTIKQILPSVIAKEGNVGVFVAESSSLVTDVNRYNLPSDQIISTSFGCICCPTEHLLKRAVYEAVSKNNWNHLLIEPPGNLDTKLVLNALLEEGVVPDRVIMTVPHPHFNIERLNPQFLRALESASAVGITKIPLSSSNFLPEGLEYLLGKHNPNASVFAIPKDGFSYEKIEQTEEWKPREIISSFTNLFKSYEHHTHHQKVLYGIDPMISSEEVISSLKDIAHSNSFVRAKGQANSQGLDFDIVHDTLEIRELEKNTGVSGYFVGFANEGKFIPRGLLERLSPKKSKIEYSISSSTPQERMQYFLHLLDQSKGLSFEFNKKVLAHFEPLDSAYHLADEIFRKDGDTIPLQMVLAPRIAIRLKAFDALRGSTHKNKNSLKAELASYMIQHTAFDKGRDFPSWIDAFQKSKIESYVAPIYFETLRVFERKDIDYFEDYREKQGPYFLSMAKRALPLLYPQDKSFAEDAKKNMVNLHRKEYQDLAKGWSSLI